MPEKTTIIDAARIALEKLGRPARITEIHAKIVEFGLYEFSTPVPEHVLRTQIRRATFGIEVPEAVKRKVFALAGDEIYEIMKETPKKRFTIGMKRIHRAADKKRIIEALTSDGTAAFREIWRLLLRRCLGIQKWATRVSHKCGFRRCHPPRTFRQQPSVARYPLPHWDRRNWRDRSFDGN